MDLLAAVAAVVGYLGCTLGNAAAAEQKISLNQGWNAVFLELEPDKVSPEAVFANLPIEQVALWLPSKAKVASLTDPVAIPNKPSEWLIWHPSTHPAAFLNTLKQVQGRRSMLIKASSTTTLTIQGTPRFERHEWQAPSFNLKGFDVDPNGPPTFARFFDGSRAHEDLKVFRLAEGAWKKVSGSEVMRRGEAYWVWCREGSDFQGPVDLNLPISGQGEVTLSSPGSAVEVTARSNGSLPILLKVGLPGSLGLEVPDGLLLSSSFPNRFKIRRQAWGPTAIPMILFRGSGVRIEVPVSFGN